MLLLNNVGNITVTVYFGLGNLALRSVESFCKNQYLVRFWRNSQRFVELENLLQLEIDPATGPYTFTVTLFVI